MFPNQLLPARALAPIARRTINWAGLLSNTQKTLNIVNQAIPIVYQVKPIFNNARTMLKIASEFTKSNSNNNSSSNKNITNTSYQKVNENTYSDDDGPSFFI